MHFNCKVYNLCVEENQSIRVYEQRAYMATGMAKIYSQSDRINFYLQKYIMHNYLDPGLSPVDICMFVGWLAAM